MPRRSRVRTRLPLGWHQRSRPRIRPRVSLTPSLCVLAVSEAGFEDAALSRVFPVVLLGPCGRLVLSWRVSPSGWRAVQVQALSTHRILEDAAGQRGGKDVFAAVFTSKADPWQQFDKHFCVRFPARAPHAGLPKGGCQLLCDRSWEAAVRHRAEQVFRGAFVETGRASELRLVGLAAGQPWALDAAPPAAPLLVCLQLDVNNAFRALDKGPAAEDTPAAARFRAFWGAKAELRRFQDGSILETLDWTDDARRGADLCEVVAAHALAQHWPFEDAGTGAAVGTQLGRALADLDAQEQARTHTAVASPELAFKALLSAFDRLSSRLRKLQLPLGVRGVAPADAALRYASVALPRAHPLAFGPEDGARHAVLRAAAAEAEAAIQQQHQGRKRRREDGEVGAVSRLVDAVDVVLQIEASGQWPDDAEAIARTKTAFYVQLAETLHKTHKGAQRCVAARDCVEVLMEGFAFRLVLRVDRERAVMLTPRKSFMGSVSTVAARLLLDNEAGEAGEQQQQQQRLQKHQHAEQTALVARARALERETVRLPLLHLHLHALHTSSDRSGGAHILGPATRLAKLWVAGQCLALHLRDEAVELLVACVFLHPQPFAAPRSAQSAFLRFLHLLARWDWANEPLKVQLGPEPFAVDVAARFLDLRERGLGAPMYLVTPDDSDAEPYWTDKQHPSAEALKLIVATAADSLALFERMLSAQAAGQYDAQQMDWLWLAAFSAATEQWDVVLHLRPEWALAAPREHRARLYKNLATQEKLLVGCRPLLLFGDALERRFGHLFQVLLDPLRGNKIGLKLLPDSMRPTQLRVATAAHAMPDPDKPGHIVPNLAEIVAEVVALGEGIVSSVEIAREELQQ
jgi:U3 small nucleolar RNA-associated protein 22